MNAIIQPDHNRRQVADFFAALSDTDQTADLLRFSYVALLKGSTWHLFRGRLDFNPLPRVAEPPVIASERVRAGTINLCAINLSPEALLDQLFAGALTLPDGQYQFAKGDGSHHMVFYMPDVNGNSLDRTVESRLQIAGEQNDKVVDNPAVTLDLKGVSGFHGSLNALLELYDLRPDFGAAGVWFVRLPIAEITQHGAHEAGATVEIRTRDGFPTEKISLGVTYYYRGAKASAQTFGSGAFRWTRGAWGNRGVMRLVLPAPTRLEVIAMHDSKPQHIVHPTAQPGTSD